MTVAVTGASPVSFISEDTSPGTMFQIPLGNISIKSDGTFDTGAKPVLKTNDKALLATLLADLLARGVIARVT